MNTLIILGSIFLLLLLILCVSLCVQVEISHQLTIKVGAFGIYLTLLPEQAKSHEKQRKKTKKKAKTKQKQSRKAAEKKRKPKKDFTKTLHFVMDVASSVVKPLIFMLSHLRLTKIDIDIRVGGGEADKVALRYAALSSGIHQLIGLLKGKIVVNVTSLSIVPDFTATKTVSYLSFQAKLRLFVIIAGFLGILYHMVKNILATAKRNATANRLSKHTAKNA